MTTYFDCEQQRKDNGECVGWVNVCHPTLCDETAKDGAPGEYRTRKYCTRKYRIWRISDLENIGSGEYRIWRISDLGISHLEISQLENIANFLSESFSMQGRRANFSAWTAVIDDN